MIWAYQYTQCTDLNDIVLRPDVPNNLYLVGNLYSGCAPPPYGTAVTFIINWQSDLNFVQWAYTFGNTNTAGMNGIGTYAYSLKIHPDWSHFYFAGQSGNWHQAITANAGWLLKFDLTNLVISQEVTMDISLAGLGTFFKDLEVTQQGLVWAAGWFDATAVGQGYKNLLVLYDQSMTVLSNI